MIQLTPGFRLFRCTECAFVFQHKTRDINSPSKELCPVCLEEECSPYASEPHPEWDADGAGNLIEPELTKGSV